MANKRPIVRTDGRNEILQPGDTLDVKLISGTASAVDDGLMASADKAKLDAIEAGATVNQTITAGPGLGGGGSGDTISLFVGSGEGISVLGENVGLDTTHARNVDHSAVSITAGAGLAGGGDITASRTLSVVYGTAAGTSAQGNDARLSNSREWTATTVSQTEAQAGTASTRRAWTAQRVRQAIAAWWSTITLTKADVGLSNVDNTSDAAKPISTATQNALNLKVEFTDVRDELISTAANVPLSANQGRILKTLIDDINTILVSDDTNLDEIQEIVNYIKQNSADLQNLGISNIAGLQSALDSKQATITGAASTVTSANLSANRVVVSNSSGKIAASSITTTLLGYLSGVTSNIQTQLNSKAASSGLGTAAYANLTASALDTTAGRVLKVGDFGLGSGTNATGASFTFPTSGKTNFFVTDVDAPTADGHYGLEIASSSNYNVQFAARDDYYWRRNQNSNGIWRKIWDSSNLSSPMQVGDFGLGSSQAPTLNGAAAVNACITTGFYDVANASGFPTTSYGALQVIGRSASRTTQIYYPLISGTTTQHIYSRFSLDGGASWSEWDEIYHSGVLPNPLQKTDVRDYLTSGATDSPLSANQGRILKNLVDASTSVAIKTNEESQTIDGGTNTTLTIKSTDSGESVLNLIGDSQGTGRLYVGQTPLHGGGIEYNGDNSPSSTGAGQDYVTLYRRSSGTTEWTAKNLHSSNIWEFRETPKVGANDVWHAGNDSPLVKVSTDQTISGAKVFSQAIKVTGGSAAAPSVTSLTDSDTGIYFPTGNVVSMATGGTNALSVTNVTAFLSRGLQVDSGQSSTLSVHADDGGEAVLGTQTTGSANSRLALVYNISPNNFGGGLEFLGDGALGYNSGAGTVHLALYREFAGAREWTARNNVGKNHWEFRETPKVGANDVWHAGNLPITNNSFIYSFDGLFEVARASASIIRAAPTTAGQHATFQARGSQGGAGSVVATALNTLPYGGGFGFSAKDEDYANGYAGGFLFSIFRESGGSRDWTARASTSNNNWEFRGSVTATSFPTSSAKKYKKNVSKVDNALSRVKQIEVIKYKRKTTDPDDNTYLGVTAESVAEVAPELVVFNENGEPDAVNYGPLSALCIQAIKEQEELHARATEYLESRLETIEAELLGLSKGKFKKPKKKDSIGTISVDLPELETKIQQLRVGDLKTDLPAVAANIKELQMGNIEGEVPALASEIIQLHTGRIAVDLPPVTTTIKPLNLGVINIELPPITAYMQELAGDGNSEDQGNDNAE